MKKEEISILSHLIKTLGEMRLKLEEAYEKKDPEEFNKNKKFMLNIQKQISKFMK
jgi:hypothetical protein